MQPNTFANIALLTLCTTAWSQSQALPQPPSAEPPAPAVQVKNFDVYLDQPSGYVFVKLPQGWKFVGKVEEQALASLKPLPSTVHTSLLPPERTDVLAGDARQAKGR